MKALYISALLLAAFFSAAAQDTHFSAWRNAPQTLTPALIGTLTPQRLNASAFHRKQWNAALGRGDYESLYASADYRFDDCERRGTNLHYALGLEAMNQQGGVTIGTEELFQQRVSSHLNGAMSISTPSGFQLGVGGELGWIQQRVGDEGGRTFDSQFDGFNHDGGMASGEDFENLSLGYFDVGAGAFVRNVFNQKYNNRVKFLLEGGVGILHFNNARKRFLANSDYWDLPRTFQAYLRLGALDLPSAISGVQFHLPYRKLGGLPSENGQQWITHPQVEVTLGGKRNALDLLVGARLANRTESGMNFDALSTTLVWDAEVPGMGGRKSSGQRFRLGVSFDFNVSTYSVAATRGAGSLEFFVTYSFLKPGNAYCCPNP